MSDDLSTPIPENPREDPDDALGATTADDHGLSGSLDSGYDLGREEPAGHDSTEDGADPGEAPGAGAGRDG